MSEREHNKPVLRKEVIDKYFEIMQLFAIETSCSEYFQRRYTGFYKLRRNDEFRYEYFKLLDKCRNNKQVDFAYIISEIYDFSGRVETSFASKMYATLNSKKPIWDSYISKKVGISIPDKFKGKEKLNEAIKAYDLLEKWYEDNENNINGQRLIEEFDVKFPSYLEKVSSTKKIDFMLWAGR